MCSYDIDRFRKFIQSNSFKATYEIDEDTFKALTGDDEVLMKFGFRLMKQLLFGEASIPLREGALEERIEQRIEQRKDIIELYRQAEVEIDKQKNDPYQFTDS